MKQLKDIVLRILRPGIIVTILLTVISAVALVFVFYNELDRVFIGYAVYILSAYTMAVIALKVPRIVGKVKLILYGNPYGSRYMTDIIFRRKLSLFLSLFINLIYALFQLIAGIYYVSFWHAAVAIYYIVVCSVRFFLLYSFHKNFTEPEKELRAYRFCGFLLFILNIAVAGMVVQMIRDGQGARYPGLMIYVMAAYAFYRIIISIVNLVKQRKQDNPVLAASTALNLATALMAVYSLETAMFAEFGEGSATENVMNTVTGCCICIFILCMAIFIITQANKKLRKLKIEEI